MPFHQPGDVLKSMPARVLTTVSSQWLESASESLVTQEPAGCTFATKWLVTSLEQWPKKSFSRVQLKPTI